MLCRSLSNYSLNHSAMGFLAIARTSLPHPSGLSTLETLPFRSWISVRVPPSRVSLHTPKAFPWRVFRSAFHRIPRVGTVFQCAFLSMRQVKHTLKPHYLPIFYIPVRVIRLYDIQTSSAQCHVPNFPKLFACTGHLPIMDFVVSIHALISFSVSQLDGKVPGFSIFTRLS